MRTLSLSLMALVLLAAGLWFSGGLPGLSSSYALFSDTEQSSSTFQAATDFPAIPATVDIEPDTLNLDSKGNLVKAFIQMTERDVNDIVPSTVKLCLPTNECLDAINGSVEDDTFKADFDRAAVIALLDGQTGPVTFTVTGIVAGRTFEGTDTERIIDPPPLAPALDGDSEEEPDDSGQQLLPGLHVLGGPRC